MRRFGAVICVSGLLAAGAAASMAAAVAQTAPALAPPLAADCGGPGAPCTVPLGSYHIALPERGAAAGTMPAFLYFHGAGRSGEMIFTLADMTRVLTARGFAVIGPNGLERPDSRFGAGWYFRPESPARRDELAFTREVLADAAARFGIDRARVTLSGFSIGGSLVWYLACKDHTVAAAYAPVAGGFWRPHPTDCAGPVRLVHTHGWRDQTVPLEGRPLRNGEIYQGDVFEGFQRWRAENGCSRLRADDFDTSRRYWRRIHTSCDPGTALEFWLHPGGHETPTGEWAEMFADWFIALPPGAPAAGDRAVPTAAAAGAAGSSAGEAMPEPAASGTNPLPQ